VGDATGFVKGYEIQEGDRTGWSWGWNEARRRPAFRALERGIPVFNVFAEGSFPRGSAIGPWVRDLISMLEANGLDKTGFPVEEMLASAREYYLNLDTGLVWDEASS
jgi:hypothetical protein